ncbi:hypothetical protein ABZW03_20490 [Kitasatospora sp. NPDC004799]|uniref:hypothetical protein n=1 Tax=Kitasatospora sp. NPDC004799 TaxID=3154460 RepID=UPI0033B1B53B
MTKLPDFRLETHFSRWEFTARYHLAASDAQTMTMAEQAGVLLLPGDVFRSELTPSPADRFRLGIGRRDPGPALAAFGDWLRKR